MGRIQIDRIARGHRPLSDGEAKFSKWVEEGPDDLVALFSTIYPLEDDEEQFDPFDVASLCVEEKLPDGRVAVQCVDVYEYRFPEDWGHIEKLARAGLERVKETA